MPRSYKLRGGGVNAKFGQLIIRKSIKCCHQTNSLRLCTKFDSGLSVSLRPPDELSAALCRQPSCIYGTLLLRVWSGGEGKKERGCRQCREEKKEGGEESMGMEGRGAEN